MCFLDTIQEVACQGQEIKFWNKGKKRKIFLKVSQQWMCLHGHFPANQQPTNSFSYGYEYDYVGGYMSHNHETSTLSSAVGNYVDGYYFNMAQTKYPYPLPVPVPIPVSIPMHSVAFSYDASPQMSALMETPH